MLIIHLQNVDDHELSYVIFSGNAASGAWQRGNWGEISRLGQRDDVVLLVPARDVLLIKTTLLTSNSRQLKQALPYALEENLITDPAEQHFVWQARKNEPTTLDVAVIERETLKGWMNLLKKHRLRVRTILPDIFALPVAGDEQAVPTIVQHGDLVRVRTGPLSGFSCPADVAPLLLDSVFQQTEDDEPDNGNTAQETERQVWFYSNQPEPWHQSLTVLREPQLDMLLQESIQQGAALNLLTGYQDASMSSFNRHWKRWRVAAVFALITLGILVGIQGMETVRLQRQLVAEEAENLALFKTVFPEINNINVRTLRSRVKSEITRLERETGQSSDDIKASPLPYMATVARAFTQEKQIRITEMRSRSGNLIIRLTSPSVELMDKLGKNLTEQLGFEPRLETTVTGNGAQATLTLEAKS